MKSILTFLLIITSICCYAQTSSYLRAVLLNPNVYYTKVDLKVTQFLDDDGNILTNPREFTIKPNGLTVRYKIVGTDGDYTIIEILPRVKINLDNTITVDDPQTDNENAANFTYYIKTKDFGLNQKITLSEKVVGTALVYPYKLRLQNKGDGATISTDFTVGYTFGLRLKLSKIPYKQNFITIVPYGFGLGSAKYFYKKDDGTYSDKKDGVAVTYYTAGLLWTVNKINFGAFGGRDAMIDKQNNWAYQGKWWFSIGLGYKFKTD